jgi:hypothetical protein
MYIAGRVIFLRLLTVRVIVRYARRSKSLALGSGRLRAGDVMNLGHTQFATNI